MSNKPKKYPDGRLVSSGGKRQYACPECGSHDISKARIYSQDSYTCMGCGRWGPWRERISKPVMHNAKGKRPAP